MSPELPAVLVRVTDTGAWLSIDDPDEVCRTFEHLWDRAPWAGPPFARSPASAAVEAMSWDPWSAFERGVWASPVFRDPHGFEIRLGARAFAADTSVPSAGVPRKARITESGGRPAPPPELRASPLVLECSAAWFDGGGRLVTERARIPAGFVVTRLRAPVATIVPPIPRQPSGGVASKLSSGATR